MVNLFKIIGSAVIFMLLYLLFKIICCLVCKSKFRIKEEILHCVFAMYIGALISVLITNNMHCFLESRNGAMYLNIYLGNFSFRLLNLVPFKTIVQQLGDAFNGNFQFSPILNLAANFVLFIPMPVLIRLSNKKIGNLSALLITFVCVVLVEGIQYFTGRTADIDDVILNMLGAVAGLLIYYIMVKIYDSKR